MLKKSLSLLLALVMAVSMLAMPAAAQEAEDEAAWKASLESLKADGVSAGEAAEEADLSEIDGARASMSSEIEPNDSYATADRLYNGCMYRGTVGNYDIDYYSFTLSSRATVSIVAIAYSRGVGFGIWERYSDECVAGDFIEDYTSGKDYYGGYIVKTLPAGTYAVCFLRDDSYYGYSAATYAFSFETTTSSSGGSSTVSAPVITSNPSSVSRTEGNYASFSVTASGTGLSYQWQYRTSSSGSWMDCSDSAATTSAYGFYPTMAQNGYQYRCKVSNSAGTVYSNAATLTVTAAKPVITAQPKGIIVYYNEKASFSVAATGTGLTYQWQYRTSESGTWTNSTADGSKTNTVTINPAGASRNGWQYRCKITNSGGTVYSEPAIMHVRLPAKPAITASPKSVTAPSTGKAVFTVAATGESLKYQWQYRTSATGTWANATATGSKTATLTISPVGTSRNGYQYRCKVTNAGGTVYSEPATLTVAAKPVITGNPKRVTVGPADKAVFSITATGKGLSYQWQFRTSASGAWTNATADGSKTNTLTLDPAKNFRNGYQYRCKVTNAGGTVYSSYATLVVKAVEKPVITASPKRVTTTADGKAVFTVAATGEGLTYQWQFRTSASGAWTSATADGSKTNTLTLDPAKNFRNGYQYRCKVTNAGGTVYSGYATLVVKAASKPVITAQPGNVTTTADGKAVFTVAATGKDLTYQWQYKVKGGTKWLTNACTEATLTIDPAKAFRDGYQYRCKVTNGAGTVYSAAATLTVTEQSAPAITITRQPMSVTTSADGSAFFLVMAEGEGLTYQWQYKTPTGSWKNNAGTDFIFDIVKPGSWRNGYQYRCVITDARGNTVTTEAATLTVK